MSAIHELTQKNRPGVGLTVAHTAALVGLVLGTGAVMQWVVGPAAGIYPATILRQIGIVAIAAVSLNIVNGYTGQFSIGHAGFVAIGAYAGGAVSFYANSLGWVGAYDPAGLLTPGHAVMLAGAAIGAGAAGAAGYMVGLPSLRLRGDYLAIVTLGFGEIVRVLFQQTQSQVFDPQAARALPISGWWPPPLGGAQGFSSVIPYGELFWIYAALALTVVWCYRLKFSSSGRAFLSIREDEIAARAMGVNLTRYKVRAFVLAAALAGLGGAFYAHLNLAVQPKDAGFQKSFELIIIVVLGGLGSISGVLLAAFGLGGLTEWLRQPTSVWPAALVALALVGVVQAVRRDIDSRARGRAMGRALLVIGVLTGLFEGLRAFAAWQGFKLDDIRIVLYALALISVMLLRPQGLLGTSELWLVPGQLMRRKAKAAAAPSLRTAGPADPAAAPATGVGGVGGGVTEAGGDEGWP